MDKDWLGKSVSLDCGALGFYQGFIKSIQLGEQTLTLEKPFQNGKACDVPTVTLSAVDIKDITFVETRQAAQASSVPKQAAKAPAASAATGGAASTVQVAKKKPRAPVAENLMASHVGQQQQQQHKGGKGGGGGQSGKLNQAARFSPALAASLPGGGGGGKGGNQRGSPRKGMQQQQDQFFGGNSGRYTPGGNGGAGGGQQALGHHSRRERERRRDEECFGAAASDQDTLAKDFDFEANLALFDKQMVFEEIDGNLAAASEESNQPDLVRLVDCNRRQQPQQQQGGANGGAAASGSAPSGAAAATAATPSKSSGGGGGAEAKYRNDENVLVSSPAQLRPVETGEVPPPGEYVTDSGLIVPAVSAELRERIDKELDAKGIKIERITELIARSTVDLAVQLFGGAHRLNPDNSHQVPLAVVLCGPNKSGGYGMAAARHLAAQGVRTVAYLPDILHLTTDLEREFGLYRLTGAKWTKKAKDLPSTPVDLVVCALEDHEMWPQERRQPWLAHAQKWALESRAPVLSIDPPNRPNEPVMPSKVSLLPGLPLWFSAAGGNPYGKLYLANLAVPKKVYLQAGLVKYQPPFGPKTVLPLHRVS